MTACTIGQVAERTGFSTSTLRYYEQHDLLEPAGRTHAGYRLHDDTSLARLRFIDRAKQLGCTLEEIANLAELWGANDCGPVQARLHALVTTRIADAQRRSDELAAFTAQLQTAAAHLGGASADGPCSTDCACLTESPEGGDESIPVVLGQREDPAIACTLPGAEMPDRMEGWPSALAHVTRREQTPDRGLRLSFDTAVPLDELALALEVRAPDNAADLVTAVFGMAA